MRALNAAPSSVLWLLGGSPALEARLRALAAERGVDPGRLKFAARLPYAEHLARCALADLFVDSLPFNAGTTASDALWAGVPVLTCAGEAFAARMAGSLLTCLGLPELIADGALDYERRLSELLGTPEALAELRARLERQRELAPLFDTRRFTRHLEAAFERMHRHSSMGEAPSSFAVDALPADG
jgi:predicted O-linked N-acetylglucosamine transferase (SPINDLY family)